MKDQGGIISQGGVLYCRTSSALWRTEVCASLQQEYQQHFQETRCNEQQEIQKDDTLGLALGFIQIWMRSTGLHMKKIT